MMSKLLALLAAFMVAPTGGDFAKKGNAYFAHIGTIAAPAYYRTVAVTISFAEYTDRYQQLQATKATMMAEFEAALNEMNVKDVKNITTRVLRRTQRSDLRLQTAQQNLQLLIELAIRAKRFAGVLLGLTGAVVAVGSAIYQAHQVTRLANDIGRVDHRVTMVVESQRKLENAIRQALELEKAEIMEERLVYELNGIYDHSAEMIESLITGIYAVRDHRLHPAVLPPQDLVEITKAVTDHKKKTGHATVFQTKLHLEDYPVSYILKEKGLIVLVHVPFVSDGEQMVRKLYHLQSAKFQSGKSFFDYHGDEKYFSINEKEEVFASHTVEDLMACQKAGTTYICTEQTMMHKTPATCVEALFRLDSDKVKDTCNKTHLGDKLKAFAVGPTTFVATESDTTRRTCNGNTKDYAVQANQQVQVHRGCIIRSDDYIIAPPLTPTTPIRVAQHTLRFRMTELPGFAAYSPVLNFSTDALSMGPVVETSSYMEDNDDKIIAGLGAALVLIIFAGLGSCFCYRRHRRRQAKDARRERRPRRCESTPIRPRLPGNGRFHFPASPPPTLCRTGNASRIVTAEGVGSGRQGQDPDRLLQPLHHRRGQGRGRGGRGRAISGGSHSRLSTPRRGEEEERIVIRNENPDHDTWEEIPEMCLTKWYIEEEEGAHLQGGGGAYQPQSDGGATHGGVGVQREQHVQVAVHQEEEDDAGQQARSAMREEEEEESTPGFKVEYHPSVAASEEADSRRNSYSYYSR